MLLITIVEIFSKVSKFFYKKGRKISCLLRFCLLKRITMKSNVHKFKEKFFNPCPVFGQLVSLVRQANIERVIQKTEADKYSKKFKTKDQLYTMLIN